MRHVFMDQSAPWKKKKIWVLPALFLSWPDTEPCLINARNMEVCEHFFRSSLPEGGRSNLNPHYRAEKTVSQFLYENNGKSCPAQLKACCGITEMEGSGKCENGKRRGGKKETAGTVRWVWKTGHIGCRMFSASLYLTAVTGRAEAQAQLPVANTRHGSGLINYGSINTLLTSGPTRYANGA